MFLAHLNDTYKEEVYGTIMSTYNSDTPISYEYGKFGQCITGQRTSTNGAIILQAPNVKYAGTKQITIELWAKCPSSTPTRGNTSIRVGGKIDANLSAQLGININYSGKIVILNYTGSNWADVSGLYNTPIDEYWHHYALVVKNGSCQIFLDGKKVVTTNRTIQSNAQGDYVFIMCDKGDYIDEVRISDTVRYESDFTPPNKPFA